MDLEVQALAVRLGEVVGRNSIDAIGDKIRTHKAAREDRETIATLEEIIYDLLSDKAELTRIAQSFEQELTAQRLTPDDVSYIIDSVIPVVEELMANTENTDSDQSPTREVEIVKKLLSVETLTILQLVGFNYRTSIGEPLTRLVARLIESRFNPPSGQEFDLRRLELQRELAVIEIARDPEAFDRLRGSSD